jgi:copper chaperone
MDVDARPAHLTYVVPGMSCGYCEAAITEELREITDVTAVGVDLEGKRVTVTGTEVDDAAARAAIAAAGYEPEP